MADSPPMMACRQESTLVITILLSVITVVISQSEERFPCNLTDSVVEVFIYDASKPAYNLTLIPSKINWVNAESGPLDVKIKFDGNSDVHVGVGWLWHLTDSGEGSIKGKHINQMNNNITVKVEPYNALKLPNLKSVKINGMEVCNCGTIQDIWDDCVDLEGYKTSTLPPETTPSRDPGCGRRLINYEEYILGGWKTKIGDWPWHISLFRINSPTYPLTYICGGTLITSSRVLTAAHCVTIGQAPILPERLYVSLGKFNFVGSNIGEQEREVFQVIVHPKFERFILKNDVAILKLASEAVVTPYVRPICLWDRNGLERSNLIEKDGQVVGWQWNDVEQKKILSEIPVRIKSDADCIRSNPLFFSKFVTDSTFCAGYVNGSAPCNGDSGGGLYISSYLNGVATWYIRGIVSLGVSRTDSASCDPKHYTVFTDVLHYRDFIDKYS